MHRDNEEIRRIELEDTLEHTSAQVQRLADVLINDPRCWTKNTARLNKFATCQMLGLKPKELEYLLAELALALGFDVEKPETKHAPPQMFAIDGISGTKEQLCEYFGVPVERFMDDLFGHPEKRPESSRQHGRVTALHTIDGKTGTLSELSKEFGVPDSTVLFRLSCEEHKPTKQSRRHGRVAAIHTIGGVTGTLEEISQTFGVRVGTMLTRMRKGQDPLTPQRMGRGQKKTSELCGSEVVGQT